jgi:putative ABC transport system permease protein
VRSVWAAAFLLRRLRAEAGIVLLIVSLVAVTSFLFAAAPLLMDRVADEALRHELRSARPVQRNVQLSTVSNLLDRGDVFSAIAKLADDLEVQLPADLRQLIRQRAIAYSSFRFGVVDPPNYKTFITLRFQSGLDEVIEFTDGRLPASTGNRLPLASGFDSLPQPPPPVPPLFEIAVSEATAREVGVSVGDILRAEVDTTDPLIVRLGADPAEARFEVVGTFAVPQPDAEIWYGERGLQEVNVGGTIESPIAFATALVAPDALGGLVSSDLPLRYQWRFMVDPRRIDAGLVDSLALGLQRLETVFQTSGSDAAVSTGIVLRSGLLDLIGRYQSQRAATEAVLSVAAIGPFALATGAVGMIGILLISRRRPNLELARGRGASGALLLGAQLWEGLLLAAPAALAGWAAAVLLLPGRPSPAAALLGISVGAAAALALVLATWPAARRQYGANERDEAPALRASPRRLVLEATAVLLAVAGALLLRQRGLAIPGQLTRFDPFLAAVPVLTTLAVGIVLLRAYPLPIRLAGWLAARRRDLVPVLGLRTVGRHAAAIGLPLLVLMLTAAFSAFASVITASVDTGQEESSWQEVGADYRIQPISGAGLSTRVDAEAVDGVEATADALIEAAVPFASEENQRSSIHLHAVDPAAYQRVVAGTPAAVDWPTSMLAAPAGGLGTPEQPLPAIVSRRLPAGSRPLNSGDTFAVTVRGQQMTMQVASVRGSFPGVPAGSAFVVTPLGQLQHAYPDPPLLRNTVLVRGPAEIEADLAATLRSQSSAIRVSSRHASYRALLDAPLVAAIATGFRLTMLVAAGYTVIAVIAALTLSAARRRREVALLRTLGLSVRQSIGLTVVEHGPSVVLAVLPGLALGIGIAFLLGPAMGLSAFAGEEGTLELRVNWPAVGVVAAGLVAVVVLAIGIGTLAARRARAADALRFGDD